MYLPPTTLRYESEVMDSRPIRGLVEQDADRMWQVYYVDGGIRPVIVEDEVVVEIFLVMCAVLLGIPEIEVRVGKPEHNRGRAAEFVFRGAAHLLESIRLGNLGTIDGVDVSNMELREIKSAPSRDRRRRSGKRK